VYHVELRQFPHNFCRFNITERELRETILEAWSRGEWIEQGERKWSPHQASLTVLEGPRLPVEQLSMGRGWRNAGRQGRDVTEELLATARATSSRHRGLGITPAGASRIVNAAKPLIGMEREADSDMTSGSGDDPALDVRLAADSVGLEVLTKLDEKPVPLVVVWQLAHDRYPGHSASDCLKLAEYAIRSLADSRLAVILTAGESGEPEPCGSGEQLEGILNDIDSWSSAEDATAALIRRA
jgi:hypothetical protein